MNVGRADALSYLWPLALACVAGVLLYLLSPILAPFLFAAILAYICNPLVERLVARKLPRTLGTLLVMALLIGAFALLLLILLPLIYREVGLLIERLPGYVDRLNEELAPWLKHRLGVELQLDALTLKRHIAENLQSGGDIGATIFSSIKISGLALLGLALNLVLVPVVLFYLLRDWGMLIWQVDRVIPRRWYARVTGLAREVDAVLAEFLRGQISVMLLMSAYYVFALWLAGLEFALPIGLLTGLLAFVPYLGMVIGLVAATIAALMQFDGVDGLLPVWIAIGIGQLIDGMAITPLLVGDRIGLHPVAVIFALLAFGQLFGFFGVLLALPASAILLVWLRQLRRDYLASGMYTSE